MRAKIEIALQRLNGVLPLKASQESCTAEVKALHQAMLRSFVTQGRILTREEMAQHVSDVDEAARVLRERDMVTFSGNGEPLGAYPFTMNEREHKVRVNGHTVNAMCALDALAVGPMFGGDVKITSRCRVTGVPVTIQMSGDEIPNLDEVREIQFGIAWGAAEEGACCSDSLCMEMIFLRDGATAQEWLAGSSGGKELFTLPEAVEFAGRFFVPLVS
jgi:mercuric reductase